MQIIDGIRGCITQLKALTPIVPTSCLKKKMKKAGKRQRVVAIHHTKRCRGTEPCCSFNVRSFMLHAPCEGLLRQWVGEVCLRAVAVSLTTPGSLFSLLPCSSSSPCCGIRTATDRRTLPPPCALRRRSHAQSMWCTPIERVLPVISMPERRCNAAEGKKVANDTTSGNASSLSPRRGRRPRTAFWGVCCCCYVLIREGGLGYVTSRCDEKWRTTCRAAET